MVLRLCCHVAMKLKKRITLSRVKERMIGAAEVTAVVEDAEDEGRWQKMAEDGGRINLQTPRLKDFER